MESTSKCIGVTGVVEYDYTAKETDELDLTRGSIIHNIKQISGGRWEGTLLSNGKTGYFPDHFVRIIDTNDENAVVLRDKSSIGGCRCKVIFSYAQVNDDELSLSVGDIIEFLGEVEEGWWRGRLRNKIGVFPSNFVKVLESPILNSKRSHPMSTAVGTASIASSAVSLTASSTSIATSTVTTIANTATTLTSTTGIPSLMTTSGTKKSNRLSIHNSKEDLLESVGISYHHSGAPPDVVAPLLPPKPQREHCRVEFPYTPQNDDELELKVGDIIVIHTMELADQGWWKGELRGKIGVFPDNFVKLLPHGSEVSPSNEGQHQQQYHQSSSSSLSTSIHSQSRDLHRTTAATTTKSVSNVAATSNNLTNTNQMPTMTTGSGNITTTTKSLIKKSTSGSASGGISSSNRKDSFGSRDSLNDILNETGLSSGNVAAQRKSLENKNLDLSNASEAVNRLGLRRQQHHHHQQQDKPYNNLSANNNNNNHSITSINSSNSSSNINNLTAIPSSNTGNAILTTSNSHSMNVNSSELRKSLENMDEKTNKTTPPPLVSKKPILPTKKTASVTSVAGNILSGLKQKVKNVESKLSSSGTGTGSAGTVTGTGSGSSTGSGSVVSNSTNNSLDMADGGNCSRMSSAIISEVPGTGSKNINVRRLINLNNNSNSIEEAADFDRVERSSILTDMRAGRVKAPKRRPPTAAINTSGDNNNNKENNMPYLNGSGNNVFNGSGSETLQSDDQLKSDENSVTDDQQLLVRPKPRDWDKKKAPWMEELKGSQVKKKTSPNIVDMGTGVGNQMINNVNNTGASVAERTSKLFGDDLRSTTTTATSNILTTSISNNSNSTINTNNGNSSSGNLKQTPTIYQQSAAMTTNDYNNISSNSSSNVLIGASMTGNKMTTTTSSTVASSSGGVEDIRVTRPSSLSIRNSRSMSPSTSAAVPRSNVKSVNNSIVMMSSLPSSVEHTNSSTIGGSHSVMTTIASNLSTISSNSVSTSNNLPSALSNLTNNNHQQQQGYHHQHYQQHYSSESNGSNTAPAPNRIAELEARVDKLEMVVQNQQRTIEELVRTLREETDRVKLLRGELDKSRGSSHSHSHRHFDNWMF